MKIEKLVRDGSNLEYGVAEEQSGGVPPHSKEARYDGPRRQRLPGRRERPTRRYTSKSAQAESLCHQKAPTKNNAMRKTNGPPRRAGAHRPVGRPGRKERAAVHKNQGSARRRFYSFHADKAPRAVERTISFEREVVRNVLVTNPTCK